MDWNKIQLIGIIALTIFCLIMLGASHKTQAEEPPIGYPPGMLTAVPLPLYCGNSLDMLLLTKEQMGMQYQGSAEVRRNGIITNDILGTMSFWYNKDNNRGVFYMTLRDTQFTCLLSYGVNWSFDTNNLLDVVNEELAE